MAEERTGQAVDEEIKEETTEEMKEETGTDNTAGETSDSEETAAEAEGSEDTENTENEPAGPDKGQEAGDKDGGIKGFFGRKKEKKDKKDAQIEELMDKVRRQLAEFENFRRRTEKEKAAMYEVGAKSVIEKILPVVDNFERGLAGTEEKGDDPFVAGMQMIYKQLISTLQSMDVQPIEAVGREFDPDLHNAVMHVEDEDAGQNMVVEEFQKGYTYRGNVVRHSMVKVAN